MSANQATPRARLMLVSGHAVLRERLHSLLAHAPAFEIVAEAESGLQSVSEARQVRPDVVLMDLRLPDSDGIAIARVIRRVLPNTRVILIVNLPDVGQLGVDAAVSAVIGKDDLASSLIPTVRSVCGWPSA